MRVIAAGMNALDAACALILECRQALESRGLQQWDARYPDRSFFQEAIVHGQLFVLSDEGQISGVVVLDERQAPEWASVDWQGQDGAVLVIHAFAISPRVQGRGHGAALLEFCEDFAGTRNYTGIRLDAFSENTGALRFYERHGYAYRGEVRFAFKPEGHQQYHCYEKSLLPGRG